MAEPGSPPNDPPDEQTEPDKNRPVEIINPDNPAQKIEITQVLGDDGRMHTSAHYLENGNDKGSMAPLTVDAYNSLPALHKKLDNLSNDEKKKIFADVVANQNEALGNLVRGPAKPTSPNAQNDNVFTATNADGSSITFTNDPKTRQTTASFKDHAGVQTNIEIPDQYNDVIPSMRQQLGADNKGFFDKLKNDKSEIVPEKVNDAMKSAIADGDKARIGADEDYSRKHMEAADRRDQENAAKAANDHSNQRVDVAGFADGSAKLTDAQKRSWDLFVDQYQAYGNNGKILISGTADNKGTKSGNEALAQKRAEAVRDYLVKEKHIDPTVIGIGKPSNGLGQGANAQGARAYVGDKAIEAGQKEIDANPVQGTDAPKTGPTNGKSPNHNHPVIKTHGARHPDKSGKDPDGSPTTDQLNDMAYKNVQSSPDEIVERIKAAPNGPEKNMSEWRATVDKPFADAYREAKSRASLKIDHADQVSGDASAATNQNGTNGQVLNGAKADAKTQAPSAAKPALSPANP